MQLWTSHKQACWLSLSSVTKISSSGRGARFHTGQVVRVLHAAEQNPREYELSHLPLHRPRLARRPGQWGGSIRGTTADDFFTLSSDPVDGSSANPRMYVFVWPSLCRWESALFSLAR